MNSTVYEPTDFDATEALFDQAFGAARFQKAAYRLRQGNTPLEGFSRVIRSSEGDMLAAAMVWPVQLRCLIGGALSNVILFGPFAVAQKAQGQRLGSALLRDTLSVLDAAGLGPVFLVGDKSLYARHGFKPAAPRHISLPGGADADRLKVRDILGSCALPSVGELAPASADRWGQQPRTRFKLAG